MFGKFVGDFWSLTKEEAPQPSVVWGQRTITAPPQPTPREQATPSVLPQDVPNPYNRQIQAFEAELEALMAKQAATGAELGLRDDVRARELEAMIDALNIAGDLRAIGDEIKMVATALSQGVELVLHRDGHEGPVSASQLAHLERERKMLAKEMRLSFQEAELARLSGLAVENGLDHTVAQRMGDLEERIGMADIDLRQAEIIDELAEISDPYGDPLVNHEALHRDLSLEMQNLHNQRQVVRLDAELTRLVGPNGELPPQPGFEERVEALTAEMEALSDWDSEPVAGSA